MRTTRGVRVRNSKLIFFMSDYKPEWINSKDAAKWLGVDPTTLFKWRSSHGLAWTQINGRTVMYDKKQLNEILNKNSTYSVLGEKKLTA